MKYIIASLITMWLPYYTGQLEPRVYFALMGMLLGMFIFLGLIAWIIKSVNDV